MRKLTQIWKKCSVVAAVIILSLPLTTLADDAPAPAKKTEVKASAPTKAAEVNGKVISYQDFERQLEIFKQQVMRGQPGQLPEALMDRAKAQVVNQMIAEELLYQEGVKQGIKPEEGFVDNELKSLKGRFASNEQYLDTLKRMKLTEEQLKGQIAHQATIRKLIEKEVTSQIKITKEDAQKYFETNKDKFHEPERVRAQHILIKVAAGDDDQKKAAARKKLEGIKKQIMAGEDFGKLAKEQSEGPSNVREGDLGYFTRGRMVKPFEDVAFSLAPNEVSDIVETQFGYHLIKVLDHQSDKDPSFEEVEPKIMALLRNEAIQQKIEPYIGKLKESAKIETFIK